MQTKKKTAAGEKKHTRMDRFHFFLKLFLLQIFFLRSFVRSFVEHAFCSLVCLYLAVSRYYTMCALCLPGWQAPFTTFNLVCWRCECVHLREAFFFFSFNLCVLNNKLPSNWNNFLKLFIFVMVCWFECNAIPFSQTETRKTLRVCVNVREKCEQHDVIYVDRLVVLSRTRNTFKVFSKL